MAAHKVVVPLAIAKDESGRDVYVYQDGYVPDNVTAESLKRLVDEGFVEKVDEPAGDSGDSDEKPNSKWSNDKLTAFAAEHSIDLGEASTKKELLAVIDAAAAE